MSFPTPLSQAAAVRYLKAQRFSLSPTSVWVRMDPPTEVEWEAIDYLVNAHDFGSWSPKQ